MGLFVDAFSPPIREIFLMPWENGRVPRWLMNGRTFPGLFYSAELSSGKNNTMVKGAHKLRLKCTALATIIRKKRKAWMESRWRVSAIAQSEGARVIYARLFYAANNAGNKQRFCAGPERARKMRIYERTDGQFGSGVWSEVSGPFGFWEKLRDVKMERSSFEEI